MNWGILHSDACNIMNSLTCTDRCHERQKTLRLEWIKENPEAALREIEYMDQRVAHCNARMRDAQSKLVNHWFFSYPHFWLWHALFDGTWLCWCWHSKEYKSLPREPV